MSSTRKMLYQKYLKSSCADYNRYLRILEPFLIDERRVTLDLLVFGVVQRLNN